jgi:hypothetical protein
MMFLIIIEYGLSTPNLKAKRRSVKGGGRQLRMDKTTG